MGCCVSSHQVLHRELRRLQKERQQHEMQLKGFNKAKQDSIDDRNRLYDAEVENAVLRKQLQDVKIAMTDLEVKLVSISEKLEVALKSV